MMLVTIVLGFLIPVVMVFGYSVWLSRKRKAAYGKMDQTIFSQLVEKCVALKESADKGDSIKAELDSVLDVVRSIKNQDIRNQSLAQVMTLYVSTGSEKEAEALLSEVEGEANRASIRRDVLGKDV